MFTQLTRRNLGIQRPASRKEKAMKKRISWWFIGVFVVASLCRVGCASAAAAPSTAEAVYEVVSPIGELTVKMKEMAPRPDSLEGKTICMISNEAFNFQVTFPVIEKLIKQKYPTAKVIPWADLPHYAHTVWSGGERSKVEKATMAAIKAKGCNVVIGGNGG